MVWKIRPDSFPRGWSGQRSRAIFSKLRYRRWEPIDRATSKPSKFKRYFATGNVPTRQSMTSNRAALFLTKAPALPGKRNRRQAEMGGDEVAAGNASSKQ